MQQGKKVSLVEHLMRKWDKVINNPALPPIRDYHRRATTAFLLENQAKANAADVAGSGGYSNPVGLLSEGAPTNAMGGSSSTAGSGNVDIYDPVLISLVRRAMPNLIAFDVLGVQPMTGPTGLIFALRSRYNNQTGDEAFYNEALTHWTGTAKGNTSHASANSQYAAHSGNSPVSGTYTTGGGFSTDFAEKLGMDEGHQWQEMAFSVEKMSVIAKSRALKAEYTVELAQDLRAVHNLDAESELANIVSSEILAEINREIIRKINWSAVPGAQSNTVTAGTFDLDVDSNGRWSVERFKGLMFQIEREANAIAKATRRGKGNIIICSSDVASALQMAGVLDYTPALANNLEVDDTGNTFVGVLNGRFKVYIDPYFADSNGYQYATIGYRGPSPFDAGMFYCPYVPLQMFRAVGQDSMQPKIGFKTRYGLVANPFAGGASVNEGAISANSNVYYRRMAIKSLM